MGRGRGYLVIQLDLALIHYPVYGPAGEVIGTATSNFDVHDLARLARTYDLGRYYLITPMQTQRELVRQVCGHWLEGAGSRRNPTRGQALRLIQAVPDLDAAVADATERHGRTPLLVATTARKQPGTIGFDRMRQVLSRKPGMLLLGTGWGLIRETMERADHVLHPIRPRGKFNHLSVRSAASIIIDRLLGDQATSGLPVQADGPSIGGER